MPLASRALRHGVDVAHVVVDHEDRAAGERRVARVQLLEQPALVGGQARLDAVQVQRRLVEQALRASSRP